MQVHDANTLTDMQLQQDITTMCKWIGLLLIVSDRSYTRELTRSS